VLINVVRVAQKKVVCVFISHAYGILNPTFYCNIGLGKALGSLFVLLWFTINIGRFDMTNTTEQTDDAFCEWCLKQLLITVNNTGKAVLG